MSEAQYSLTISFIIPVLNGEEHIGQCLDHIRQQMKQGDEVIVVDNGSEDNTAAIVDSYSGVTLLQYPSISIGALRNRGAEIAQGETLAFIDSDCLIYEGWRTAVEEALSNNRVGATGSSSIVPNNASWVEKGWLFSAIHQNAPVHYLPSGNLIVRRSVFNEMHGFNEQLTTDEDSDLGSRLTGSGNVIVLSPGTRMYHLGNSKSLHDFIRRQKWHASGIIQAKTSPHVDKAMVMTFAFATCILIFILSLPGILVFPPAPLLGFALLVLVPGTTAVISTSRRKAVRYVVYATVLYFFFYLARVSVLFKHYLPGRHS